MHKQQLIIEVVWKMHKLGNFLITNKNVQQMFSTYKKQLK